MILVLVLIPVEFTWTNHPGSMILFLMLHENM